MRSLAIVVFLIPSPLLAQETKVSPRDIDKQLFDVLKDVHNRGADLYNAGHTGDCYRLFQGSLQTARAALAHRPGEQKFIDDEMARAAKFATISERAFALHESIEKLRERLRMKAKDEPRVEVLVVPPREYQPKPKKIVPPVDGVTGVVYWEGKPLAGAEMMFVSRGMRAVHIAEATTDKTGRYTLDKIRPGKYTVLLTMPGDRKKLPERYATTTDSPLIVDVKGGGDQLDLLLQ